MTDAALVLTAKLQRINRDAIKARGEVKEFIIEAATPYFKDPGFSLINHETRFRSRKVARLAKPLSLKHPYSRTAKITYIANDGELFGKPYVPYRITEFSMSELVKLIMHIEASGFSDKGLDEE